MAHVDAPPRGARALAEQVGRVLRQSDRTARAAKLLG